MEPTVSKEYTPQPARGTVQRAPAPSLRFDVRTGLAEVPLHTSALLSIKAGCPRLPHRAGPAAVMAHGYPAVPRVSPAVLELPSFWAAPQQPQAWGWPDGEGPASSSASSPASSADSSCGGCCSPSPRPLCPWGAGLGAKKGSGRRARLGLGQRQSASQREKHRMRRLAQALRTLRRYLPASVAPAGQSLTKIETLRLAIRYIAHLSELLGLRQEEAALALPRRPPGSACCPPTAPAWPQDAGGASSCCPASTTAPEAASWPGAPWSPGAAGEPTEPPAAGEALQLMAELAGLGLSPQSLPDELAEFLEGFLPLTSQG
ncbi:mesoderm posterior protein 1-like [Rhineura floridana]|uniref:mesoderm posterior protein 1-like n=1 Tax=Rhineura floridana TaxID=261503 RepID=UPI002AC80A0D|nr:mesoderm posterior protein 1-like [Rhineura floridana]